jgi:hypothetical protein
MFFSLVIFLSLYPIILGYSEILLYLLSGTRTMYRNTLLFPRRVYKSIAVKPSMATEKLHSRRMSLYAQPRFDA